MGEGTSKIYLSQRLASVRPHGILCSVKEERDGLLKLLSGSHWLWVSLVSGDLTLYCRDSGNSPGKAAMPCHGQPKQMGTDLPAQEQTLLVLQEHPLSALIKKLDRLSTGIFEGQSVP